MPFQGGSRRFVASGFDTLPPPLEFQATDSNSQFSRGGKHKPMQCENTPLACLQACTMHDASSLLDTSHRARVTLPGPLRSPARPSDLSGRPLLPSRTTSGVHAPASSRARPASKSQAATSSPREPRPPVSSVVPLIDSLASVTTGGCTGSSLQARSESRDSQSSFALLLEVDTVLVKRDLANLVWISGVGRYFEVVLLQMVQ